MYVTFKLDGSGCRIHSVSDGDEEIVTKERYVDMPWKMVTRGGANATLKEAAELIKKREVEREEERRLVSKFENEPRDKINEILGLSEFIDEEYVKERYPEIYNFGPGRLGIHFEDKLALRDHSSDSPRNQYKQLDYFKKAIKAYQGLDEEVEKYVEKVKSFIDKPLDEFEIEDIREIRKKKLVKFPPNLEVSAFYEENHPLLQYFRGSERTVIRKTC